MEHVHRVVPLLLVLLLACTGHATTEPPEEPVDSDARDAAEWDVREAVFRHLFEKNASGGQQTVSYYFLALGDSPSEREDPPPEFLERFREHTPRVVAVSKSAVSQDSLVVHEDDGKPGLIFQITHLTWVDDDTVEVQGGYYEANLSASGNLYRVEKQDDGWVVTDDRMQWIS